MKDKKVINISSHENYKQQKVNTKKSDKCKIEKNNNKIKRKVLAKIIFVFMLWLKMPIMFFINIVKYLSFVSSMILLPFWFFSSTGHPSIAKGLVLLISINFVTFIMQYFYSLILIRLSGNSIQLEI